MISQQANRVVTVIIPSYNYAQFIGQAIESVQGQTYPNWECIVVDDGSTDNTYEVVSEYCRADERLKYIKQANQGLAAARNTGLKAAKGEFIQFLDSDDLIEAKKIEKHVDFLMTHPDVDIVYGDTRYFRTEAPNKREYSFWGEDRPWMPRITEGMDPLRALVQRVIVVHSPVLRRSVVAEVGLFEESMKACEDWHYWIRCAALGKRFRFLDEEETLALIRAHPQSMSQNDRLMIAQIVGMRKRVARFIHDPEIRKLNRLLASDYLGYGGGREIETGNLATGMWFLFRAGLMSSTWRGRFKWFFCALVAPIVPKRKFIQFLATPVRNSVTEWLKLPFHTG
jgi:glycosyltransferase involved in cell wall biosynthesis